MATADISTVAIAGLHYPPTSHDLAISLAVYAIPFITLFY